MQVISDQQQRFNKALGLLGDVKSLDRVFFNSTSLLNTGALRNLGDVEKEQTLTYGDLQKNEHYHNKLLPRLHPDETQPKDEKDEKGRSLRYNTNQFRKFSSGIVINAAAAAMLAGTRVDLQTGNEKTGQDPDLETAVLLYDLIGRKTSIRKPHETQALLEKDQVTIDKNYIKKEFGEKILQQVEGIQETFAEIKEGHFRNIRPEYINAVTAIHAARVREAAKVVALRLNERLPGDAYYKFGHDNGVGTNAEPAAALLSIETKKLKSLLALEGVDEAIKTPIETKLLPAVEQYLDHKGKTREVSRQDAENLFGKEGAYQRFNEALPINQYKTHVENGHDYSDLDVRKMLLLVSRYHQDAVRKDGSTILSHVLDTFGQGSRALGGQLRNKPTLVTLAHDLIEDGGHDVAGFNASARKLYDNFGMEMALLVAEMTDDFSKKYYAQREAQADAVSTGRHSFAESMIKVIQEDLGAQGLSSQEIDAVIMKHLKSTPFTLTTSGPKVADVVSTARKLLEEPQSSAGMWRHSGARIGWLVDAKGYVNGLHNRIAGDVLSFFNNPDHSGEQKLPSGHNPAELNTAMLNFLATSKKTLDQYSLQNLTILADEFGLGVQEREALRDKFLDSKVSNGELKAFLDATLINERVDSAFLGQKNLSVAFKYDKTAPPDSPPRSDFGNLMKMRDALIDREVLRKQILSAADLSDNKNMAATVKAIHATMAEPDWKALDREVLAHYDAKMGIQKERFANEQRLVVGSHTRNLDPRGTGWQITT